MPNKNLKGTLGTRSLLALLTLAIFAIRPPVVSSFDTFFAPNCGGCHVGQTLANSCGMCHAHGVHSSTAQNDFNVTGVPNKTTYAPGETVSVVVSGGYRATAARAVLYDEVGTQIDISSGATAGGIAPVNAPLWPVTLSAPAPTTPGAYTWTVSWYGHKYDLTETGGGTTFFGPNWTPDTNNLNHGWENVFVNFTVVAAALSITKTSPLPSGTVGTAYNTTLTATGGTEPFTWDNVGVLPAGVTLSAAGVLSGTPTAEGAFNFTVEVTDSATPAATATKAFDLTINPAGAPDNTAPTVLSTVPDNNATGVATNAAITATFSEAIDNTTVDNTSFFVTFNAGADNVLGTVSVSLDNLTVTFTPSAPLLDNTVYTATLDNTITDLAGNALAAAHVWSFDTGPGAAPPPSGGGDDDDGGCAIAGTGGGAKEFAGTFGALALAAIALGLRRRRKQ